MADGWHVRVHGSGWSAIDPAHDDDVSDDRCRWFARLADAEAYAQAQDRLDRNPERFQS